MWKAAALSGFLLVAAANPATSETLGKGMPNRPVSIDPAYSLSWGEVETIVEMFEGLTAYGRDGTIGLAQAESYEVDDSGTVYTFTLRDNLQWSDGAPVTAHDFELGARRLFDSSVDAFAKPTYVAMLLKNAEDVETGVMPLDQLGVEALDDRHIRYILDAPAPYFISLVGQSGFFPVPSHLVDRLGNDWAKPEYVVSNGPYVLIDSSLHAAVIKMRKNPLYRDADNVYYDELNLMPYEQTGQIENAIMAGQVHVVTRYTGGRSKKWFEDVARARFVPTPKTGTGSLMLNTDLPKLSDPRLKRAISMVIDRDELVAGAFTNGEGESAYRMAAPSVAMNWQPVPPAELTASYPQRIAEAKALMEELGYSEANRLPFTMTINSSSKLFRQFRDGMRAMLSQIYIDVGMEEMSWVDYNEMVYQSDIRAYEAAFSFYNNVYDHPNAIYSTYLGLSSDSTHLRLFDEASPRLRAAIAALLTLPPGVEFNRQAETIEEMIDDEWNSIPLFYSGFAHIHVDTVDIGTPNFNKLLLARNVKPVNTK